MSLKSHITILYEHYLSCSFLRRLRRKQKKRWSKSGACDRLFFFLNSELGRALQKCFKKKKEARNKIHDN